MKKITYLFLTLSLFISTVVVCQNKNIAQPELDSGTIEEQFDYILTKSSSFKEFQLIRKASLLKVKDHTLDSIRTIKKDLIDANKSVAQIERTTIQLENEIQTLKNEIETISKEIDSISFFGTLISKSIYSTVVWSIIIFLLLALVLFIARFSKSRLVEKQCKNELTKVEIEFEDFRKKSLKREQETMRKLQDEINKNNP